MPWVRGHYRRTSRGHVWVKGHSKSSSGGGGFFIIILLAAIPIYLAYLLIKGAIVLVAKYWLPIIIVVMVVATVLLVALVMRIIIRHVQRKRMQSFATNLNKAIEQLDFSSDSWDSITALRRKLGRHINEIRDQLQGGYRHIVASTVDMGKTDTEELNQLLMVEQALGLTSDAVTTARHDGFCDIFRQAISDGVLNEQEETSLRKIALELHIPAESIQAEVELIDELSEARKVTEGPPSFIQSPVGLRVDEKCLYSTAAIEIKRKTNSGQFSYVPSEKGNLTITTMRVLFTSEGSLSIKYDNIVQCQIQSEQKYLSIIKDGRQTPYYFQVPKPFLTLEYLKLATKLLRESV